ncbi:DUF475 domain-containing protein, partial [Tepidimonas sp.]|uniref:DUF475 domain-containing protein n=1 Tax=Tepidimonas sp. TaxID=2002775 RepID=UPI002FE32491
PLERRLVRAAKFDEISVFIALAVMFSTHWWVPQAVQTRVFVAGVVGILLYLAVDAVGALFEPEEAGEAAEAAVHRLGFARFLYLEVLDASFSSRLTASWGRLPSPRTWSSSCWGWPSVRSSCAR